MARVSASPTDSGGLLHSPSGNSAQPVPAPLQTPTSVHCDPVAPRTGLQHRTGMPRQVPVKRTPSAPNVATSDPQRSNFRCQQHTASRSETRNARRSRRARAAVELFLSSCGFLIAEDLAVLDVDN